MDRDLTDLIHPHCTVNSNRPGSTKTTSGGGFKPVWAQYAHTLTHLHVTFKLTVLYACAFISTDGTLHVTQALVGACLGIAQKTRFQVSKL